jgi:hypothetical protein
MPEDMPVAARLSVRWIDVFPWIEASVVSLGGATEFNRAWWLETVAASDSGTCAQRFADLSRLALQQLTDWPIGQIFPALPAKVALAALPMTNRAKNALAQSGYRTAGNLRDLELHELLDLPNVGVATIDSILQALADAATLAPAPAPSPAGPAEAGEEDLPAPDHPIAREPLTRQVSEDLQAVARWYALTGFSGRPLLGAPVPPGTPPDVVKARQRLDLVTAVDILGMQHAEHDAAWLLQDCLTRLDDRGRQVLARRRLADVPETLDELSRAFGLTAERIRQIERRAHSEMSMALEAGRPLGSISAAVRDIIGTVMPLTGLLALMPSLSRIVEAAGQPAWQVLSRIDGSYEIKDGWCAVPTIRSAQDETMARVREAADQYGVALLSGLCGLNSAQAAPSAQDSMGDWLTYCGCAVSGDHVYTRLRSVGDRAAAILSVAGNPMTAHDILDRLGAQRTLQSLRNAMGSDERFCRVDRDRWALAEWGLETYTGIRALIRDEIAREKGQIPLDTLIERITGKYSVSASSVIAYANGVPFETRDGVVRLAAGARGTRKSPQRTRRLYRRASAWLYRVTVTRDHMRGSGFPAPVAVAGILGIQPGQTRYLDSGLGPQAVSWTGSQPAFGSVLRFLANDRIEAGSEIFLVLGDDGSFRVEPVEAPGSDALERALALTGSARTSAHRRPCAVLAAAIGLPENSPAASVIGAYRDRGDSDITDLLLAARDRLETPDATGQPRESPDIDAVLDLL